MKKLLFFVFTTAFMLVYFSSPAYAQTVTIKLMPASSIILDEDTSVAIELLDEKNQPLTKVVPQVVFAPSKFVENLEIYDCSDSSEFDNCQANNRGVDGIFEALFTIVDSPVTMTVTAKGKSESLKLNAEEKKAVKKEAEPSAAEEETTAEETSPKSAPSTTSTSLALDQIQVGPTPSIWVILVPLALILVVVTVFVVKTTD